MGNAPSIVDRYHYGQSVTVDGEPGTVVDVDTRAGVVTVQLDREGSDDA